MFHPQCLQTAGHCVAEMQPQHDLPDQVDHHEQRILKRVHHLCEHVSVAPEIQPIGKGGIHPAGSQMQQMKDNEQDQQTAGECHGSGGP